MTNPVQTWTSQNINTAGTATASTLPVTGHGVVVASAARQNVAITSVTDNQSPPNTFTKAVSYHSNTPYQEIWYCNAVTVNQSTYTVTVNYATSVTGAIYCAEVIGLNGVDQTGSAYSGSNVTALSVSNASTNTNANDFVIAVFGSDYTGGAIGISDPPSTGYTSIGKYDGTFQASDCGYKIVNAIETSSAAWTWSTSYNPVSAVIASFELLGNPNTALETIKTGTTPDDATGDAARVGGTKINDSLVSVYSALGGRATTPGAFNISSAAGTTTTLIDSTTTWATNQYAGQYVTITTGALPTSSGGTTTPKSNLGYSALIASNTSTTLTFAALPFATTLGCGYDISPIVTTNSTDGQATAVGGTAPSTLIDSTKSWTTNQWQGDWVTLLSGAFAGQSAPIASNTSTTLTLSTLFATAIASGTTYVIGTGPTQATQYLTSGTTVTILPGVVWLELNGPTTMTATYSAGYYEGQPLQISTTTAITSFTTVGATVSGAPSTLSANTGIGFRWHAATTTWYRVQ